MITPITHVPGRKDMKDQESPNISLTSICEATNNFSESNKLGQGGFGSVYKVIVSLTKYVTGIWLQNIK